MFEEGELMVLATAKKKIIPCFQSHTEQKTMIDLVLQTDLSASVIRFYLQVLVEAGLLEYTIGRNKKYYYNMVETAVCIEKDGTVLCMTPNGGV